VDAGFDRVREAFPQAGGDADGRGVDVPAGVEVGEVGRPVRGEVEAGRALEASSRTASSLICETR